MSFQEFKSDNFCVGGRHRSSTEKISGGIISKGSKVLFGFCSICNRKKSMTVSDNTIQAEGFGDFLGDLGKKRLNVSKKMAKNVLFNLTRALTWTTKIATAAASKKSKQALSTLPQMITFYNDKKSLYWGKVLYFYTI